MSDMPRIKTSKLTTALSDYAGAAAAVREGIATHVQKHRAEQHAARKALAAQRNLAAPLKPNALGSEGQSIK